MTEEILFLIVDDNDGIREELVSYLHRYGIKTIDVANAMAAREVLVQEPISLAIVDVVMPGESGFELTKWITGNLEIPVILLTSLDDVIDRVTGLEIGADDYVPKPFDPRELLARAKAVLRRQVNQTADPINRQIKNLCRLDQNERLVFSSGRIEKLRPLEVKLLQILIANAGACVNRQQLFEAVLERDWNPEDRSIDNLIARLRKVMENDPANPEAIKTIRNKGYSISQGIVDVQESCNEV